MKDVKLYVKNMVCDRCILIVTNCFNDLAMLPKSVKLGEVDLGEAELSPAELSGLTRKFESLGFALIRDKKEILVEGIKTAIIELVHGHEEIDSATLKTTLVSKLNYDYAHMSNTFSELEGMSIKQYQINQKIEKIKELLLYNELSLTEISYQLGYSSLAHLSNQFKKVTGLTPSEFKSSNDMGERKPLDKLV